MKSILGQWRPVLDQTICTSNGSTLNPQLRGDHSVQLWIGQYVLVMGQLFNIPHRNLIFMAILATFLNKKSFLFPMKLYGRGFGLRTSSNVIAN